MKPEGLHLFNNRKDKQGYTTQSRNLELSSDYEKQIKANEKAWTFFNNLAPSYKKNSIWWVMSAKREGTQLKRLDILITSSQEQLKIPILQKNKIKLKFII